MRDRIISNVLIKIGNRIKKKELDYLENVLVEEFRDVQIKKESTELTEYNDSLRKLKDTFLATLIVENKSSRTISQYNLHLTQFADYFAGKGGHLPLVSGGAAPADWQQLSVQHFGKSQRKHGNGEAQQQQCDRVSAI